MLARWRDSEKVILSELPTTAHKSKILGWSLNFTFRVPDDTSVMHKLVDTIFDLKITLCVVRSNKHRCRVCVSTSRPSLPHAAKKSVTWFNLSKVNTGSCAAQQVGYDKWKRLVS